MLLTLVSMLGGGLMRLLPELITIWNRKTDNAHELAMLDRQIELEKTKSGMRQDEIRTQGEADMNVKELEALSAALASQMQKTGIWLADVLNFLVRPLTTYYFLALHGLAKVAMFYLAVTTGISGWGAILKLYTVDDVAILSGILSFWFVGRVIDKRT